MAEPSSKRQKTAPRDSSGPRITDPRFANIQSDPRYRLPGKKNKVKLDKRFARVLQDEDFVKRAKVDRYGRPLDAQAEKKRLKRKYEFDEDEDESDAPDDDGEVLQELSRFEKRARDPLREGRETESESETSDESSEEDEDADLEELAPTQQQDIPSGEVTSRVALVNLDWDNIRAADLMAVFSSFLPSSGGSLLRVAIYPSEFGKERLEREEMEGPPKEIFSNAAKENSDEDVPSEEEDDDEEVKKSLLKDENGEQDFNPTALRKYQLERLRYFYAVLTFSSKSVAKHIYDAVDGTEYLRTANFFDLRFIPDDTDFSTDTPREECERIPDDYRPNEFVTDALQHSKVKLTWDAEDAGRKEAVARAFKGGKAKGAKGMQEMIDENDLKAYLASDNSDDEDDDDNEVNVSGENGEAPPKPALSKKELERQRMRSLLGLPPDPIKPSKREKGPIGDMQITFTSGLNPSKDDKKRSVFENSPEPEETTVEKYVRKEKERKQRRREKMRAARGGADAESAEAAAPDAIASDREMEGPSNEADDLGFDDPFFADSATKEPETAKSSNKQRKEERLKKKQAREAQDELDRKQRAELELLMAGDNDEANASGDGPIRHFDMREIEKAEKRARKAEKKAKRPKDRQAAANIAGGGDDFNVDTADPRFSRLFSSHEYAIDPTNPRFKETKGMKALLEEGRKRKGDRARPDDLAAPEVDAVSRKSKKDKNRDKSGGALEGSVQQGDDVKSLVQKIKNRNRRAS
jgi:hypothetical protein